MIPPQYRKHWSTHVHFEDSRAPFALLCSKVMFLVTSSPAETLPSRLWQSTKRTVAVIKCHTYFPHTPPFIPRVRSWCTIVSPHKHIRDGVHGYAFRESTQRTNCNVRSFKVALLVPLNQYAGRTTFQGAKAYYYLLHPPLNWGKGKQQECRLAIDGAMHKRTIQ